MFHIQKYSNFVFEFNGENKKFGIMFWTSVVKFSSVCQQVFTIVQSFFSNNLWLSAIGDE